jgi:hypothetical protein
MKCRSRDSIYVRRGFLVIPFILSLFLRHTYLNILKITPVSSKVVSVFKGISEVKIKVKFTTPYAIGGTEER